MLTLWQIFIIVMLIIVLVLSAILIAINSKNVTHIIDNKKTIKKGGMLSTYYSDQIYNANDIASLGISKEKFNEILSGFISDIDINIMSNGDIYSALEDYELSKIMIADNSSGNSGNSGSSSSSGSSGSSSSDFGSSSSGSSSGFNFGSSGSSGSSGLPISQHILVIGGGNPDLYGEAFFEVGNHDSASWGNSKHGEEVTDWNDLNFWKNLDKYLGPKQFDVLYIDQGSESHMYNINIDNMYRCLAPHLSENFILILPGDGSTVGRYSINSTVMEFIKRFRRLTPFGRIGFSNMRMGVNDYQYYTLYNMSGDTSVIKFRSGDLNSAICQITNAQGNTIHNPNFKCITDVSNIADFIKSRILGIDNDTRLAEENAHNLRLEQEDKDRRMREDAELARKMQEDEDRRMQEDEELARRMQDEWY